MSVAEVEEVMGAPDLTEEFGVIRGRETRVLHYWCKDGQPVRKITIYDCRAIVFFDGRMAGAGYAFYMREVHGIDVMSGVGSARPVP